MNKLKDIVIELERLYDHGWGIAAIYLIEHDSVKLVVEIRNNLNIHFEVIGEDMLEAVHKANSVINIIFEAVHKANNSVIDIAQISGYPEPS